MIIYIAGPITNNKNYKAEFNEVQKNFEYSGNIVLNPTWLPSGLEDGQYMKICIAMMEIAEMVFFLEGWENSKGACFEYEWCKYNEKYVHFQGN